MDNCQWLTDPIAIYDKCFNEDRSCAKKRFLEIIESALKSSTSKVPALNEVSIDSIPDGHLVVVHGMVQDMFNCELYMDEFNIPSRPTDTVSLCFRDFGPRELDLSEEPQNVKFSERQSFYVVPVPGETDWVQKVRMEESQYILPFSSGSKRNASETLSIEAKRKRSEGDSETKKARKQFPLIEEECNELKTGVLVRVYENSKDSLKINEVVHIYGILEHTRLGSSAFHDECMQDGKGSEPVPRVHALFIRRLKHNNPLVIDCSVSLSSIIDDIKAVRQNIMKLLTSCLHCDEAVAQYTLLHLISSRLLAESPYPTTLPALNLICIATSTGLIPDTSSDAEPMEVQTECDLSLELWSRLHEIVPKLVTQLATVDLTLDSLNNGPCLMPIRDPSKGVLDAGRLQVPDGTQILVDETKMSAGQLQARGLLNLRALTLLATEQRVPYDFQFYTQEWETNARVLIVSCGPSLIKPVLSVPYLPASGTQSTVPVLSNHQWDDIRKYITLLPHSNSRFTIDAELQEQINGDFVRWRRDRATFIEADEFAVMLCLLRLLCLSYGDEQATAEHWHTICTLEQERRTRMKAFKIQPAA